MSSLSQMRQPAGKITLTSASLASASQARVPRLGILEFALREPPSATTATFYSFLLSN
jgi:hypothetical protein